MNKSTVEKTQSLLPAISIIVPVYNVEAYLPLCLKTLRAQTLENIEIICVNDGTLDSSGDILAIAASCDSRVKIISKENGGLSSARNAGIKQATGRYIMFVDSDDFLVDTACQTVLKAFEETGAEIVTFGAYVYPPEAADDWLNNNLSPVEVFYPEFNIDILFKEQSNPFVWRTACSRELLERTGLLFDESIKYGEDMVFHFMLYPRAQSTAFIPDKLYWYRYMRKDSLMSNRSADAVLRVKDHLLIIDTVMSDWEVRGLLSLYPAYMLNWAFYFVIFDIRKLETSAQYDVLNILRGVLARAFSNIDIYAQAEVNEQAAKLYDVIMKSEYSGKEPPLGDALINTYDRHNYAFNEKRSSYATGSYSILRRIARRIVPRQIIDWVKRRSEAPQAQHDDEETVTALSELLAEYEKRKAEGTL